MRARAGDAMRAIVAAVIVGLVATGVAYGALSAEQAKETTALLKQCGDKDFAVREAATS